MRWIVTGFLSTLLAVVVAGGLLIWIHAYHPSSTRLALQSNVTSPTIGSSPQPIDSTPKNSGENSSRLPNSQSRTVNDIPVLSTGSSGLDVTRLQQLLAELGYLPVQFTPDTAENLTLTNQMAYTQTPPTGQWQFRYKSTPSSLRAMWHPGVYNTLIKGAVMAFQQTNHLDPDGVAGPHVWKAILQARVNSQRNPTAYSYVTVSMHRPERLTIWSNGKSVVSSPTNTGISASPTVTGTYPVYLQFRSQTMAGTDPSGQHYSDPGVPWVSYFYGGEAIHGFVRPSYGSPQSLGCVELPLQAAAEAWKYIHIGTLVTIS